MDPEKPTRFHLLELNLISAQELKPVKESKPMQTYVVAWIDPGRKLISRIDSVGRENPTWNDKFVFVIDDDKILNKINSTLAIEIYRIGGLKKFYSFQWKQKDEHIGTVRILLSNLFCLSNRYSEGMRGTYGAFQIRRPSGRPQGILNIGVMFLDGSSHELMNEFMGATPAVDFRELMGGRSEEIVMKGQDFPTINSLVKKAFCGLFPRKKVLCAFLAKKRKPKKIESINMSLGRERPHHKHGGQGHAKVMRVPRVRHGPYRSYMIPVAGTSRIHKANIPNTYMWLKLRFFTPMLSICFMIFVVIFVFTT